MEDLTEAEGHFEEKYKKDPGVENIGNANITSGAILLASVASTAYLV